MRRKVLAYKMIRTAKSDGLNDLVNAAIDEGFEPVGTVQIEQPIALLGYHGVDEECPAMFCQTMYMYSDFKDEDQ